MLFYQGWLLYFVEIEQSCLIAQTKGYQNRCVSPSPDFDVCTDWQIYASPKQAIEAGMQLVEKDLAELHPHLSSDLMSIRVSGELT
jgi:hypothetical protein